MHVQTEGLGIRLYNHRHTRAQVEAEDDGGGFELLACGWDYAAGDVIEDVDGYRFELVEVSSYVHTDSPRGNYITARGVLLNRQAA